MKLFLFTFLCFVASVKLAESLLCYDCDPTIEGECVDPVQRNAKITFCDKTSSNIAKLRNSLPPKKSCFSIKYESNNGQNDGVYRGCLVYPPNEDPCENIKKQVSGGQVKFCRSCDIDRCNVNQPDTYGDM